MKRKELKLRILTLLLCGSIVGTVPVKFNAMATTTAEQPVVRAVNPTVNLINGATVQAESTYSLSAGYEASKAIDGNAATRWASDSGKTSNWFEIDFKESTTLNQLVISEYFDSAVVRRIKDIKIEYWDGVNWVESKTVDFSVLPAKGEINFDSKITTTKIKLTLSNPATDKGFNITEIEVYNKNFYKNYALNKTATATNYYQDAQNSLTPSLAVDGNTSTRWSSVNSPVKDFWFEINLGEKQLINNVVIKENSQYIALDKIEIYYSDTESGDNWTLAKKVYSSDYSLDKDIYFNRVTAQRIKLVLNRTSGTQGYNINEVEVYNKADEDVPPPSPQDGYIKPIPSNKPNVYQRRKQDMKYGMFLHFGVNTFVDQEWTDGSIPAKSYAPTAVDAEQWVRTAWEAGMNYVVLITKHHDGFSMWNSQYTDYDVASSSNQTDVVKAVSEACKKYGIKLGLYYSLWDRNWDSRYGKQNNEQYVDYMTNQLKELMDGRYGEVAELWLDGSWEKPAKDWQLGRVYDTVKKLQPGCQISTNLTLGMNNFPANYVEGSEIAYFPSDFRLYDPYMTNPNGDPKLYKFRDETYYLPFESTQCLKSTWFYNTKNDTEASRHTPDKIKEITDQLVNQQNTFVLNAAPNKQGKLQNSDIDTLYTAARKMGIARGSARIPTASENLAIGSKVTVSEQPYAGYEGTKLVDGASNTRWATDDTKNNKWAEIDFGKEIEFDKLSIYEAIDSGMGERINNYYLEYWNGTAWVKFNEGTRVGSKKDISIDTKIKTSKIRFTCSSAGRGPTIYEIQVFNTLGTSTSNQKSVRVEYVNEKGYPVQAPDVKYGELGADYSVTSKDLSNLGYALVNSPNNTTGKLTETETVVRYVYKDFGEGVVPSVVVSKPNGVTLGSKTNNNVTINWSDPDNTFGLTGYTIYKDGKVIATVDKETKTYQSIGLRANTIYGFKIVSNYINNEKSKPVSLNVRTDK